MKKALLVTKTGKNYGAVLQAVALFSAISEAGVDAQVLQWPYKALNNSYSVFKKRFGIHESFYNLCTLPYAKKLKKSSERFLRFREEHLKFTRPYNWEKDVLEDEIGADVMVVGSDQVWNPVIKYSPVYFLDFGKETIKRVSYAASIGLKEIPVEYVQVFQKHLERFSQISVREESGKDALKQIGVDSQVVLDPTLLYNRTYWSEIAGERLCQEEYILVYSLYESKVLDDLVRRAKGDLGCKVIVVQPNARYKFPGDKRVYDAGPKEFLSYIKNAKFVITTSFHGTLFSINFGIPFVTVTPGLASGRMSDILSRYGMTNRLVSQSTDFSEALYLLKEDYREKLSVDVAESRRYLLEMLAE